MKWAPHQVLNETNNSGTGFLGSLIRHAPTQAAASETVVCIIYQLESNSS